MFVRALAATHNLAIASTDPEAVASTFPDVQTLEVEPNYSLRAFFGIRSRRRDTGPVDAGGSSDAEGSSKTGVDLNLLIHFFHTTIWRVLTYMRRCKKPVAIIAIDAALLPTARLLSKVLGVPYCYFMCEIFPNQYYWMSKKLSNTLALVEGYGVRKASKIFVPNVVFAKLLARRYGVDRSKFVEVCTCPDVPTQSAANNMHFPLRLYYHGTNTPGRGIDNLIKAMSQVSGAHLYLRLVGQVEGLHELISEENLEEKVTFLEPVRVEELTTASTEFDIGIIVACPRSANGRFVIGYKFFEYMAAGLALVCTRSHVLGPFLRRYPIGATFAGCEIDGIAAAIRYCVENPEEVALWKSQARVLAEKEFNAEHQALRIRQTIALQR